MQLFFRSSTRTVAIDVDPLATIAAVMGAVQDREGIPADHQRLIYDSKTLVRDKGGCLRSKAQP